MFKNLFLILNLILLIKSQNFFKPAEKLFEDEDNAYDSQNDIIKDFLLIKPIKQQPQLNIHANNLFNFKKRIILEKSCGLVKPKISLYVANGRKTDHYLWPWNVQLIINTHLFKSELQIKNLDKVFCGGTIISQNYILTAAHCFDDLLTDKNLEILKNDKNKLLEITAKSTTIVFNSASEVNPLTGKKKST